MTGISGGHRRPPAAREADRRRRARGACVCARRGRAVFHEHGAITRFDPHTQGVETLVDHWRGLRLNSPNDVVQKRDGSMWFTDPGYGFLLIREWSPGLQPGGRPAAGNPAARSGQFHLRWSRRQHSVHHRRYRDLCGLPAGGWEVMRSAEPTQPLRIEQQTTLATGRTLVRRAARETLFGRCNSVNGVTTPHG